MARLQITLVGTSPLMVHNPQLADPMNDWARQIKEITDKRTKQTDADRFRIKELEWYGGLYVGDTGPVLPTINLRKCFYDGGVVVGKKGEATLRALIFPDLMVPILYEGPRDLKALYAHGLKEDGTGSRVFSFETSVGIGSGTSKKRVQRTRPCFPQWSIVASVELLEDVLSREDFARVTVASGTSVGLGDGRRIGFGRFNATIKSA